MGENLIYRFLGIQSGSKDEVGDDTDTAGVFSVEASSVLYSGDVL